MPADGSVTTRAVIPPELLQQATGEGGVEHAPLGDDHSGSGDHAAESHEGPRGEAETAEVEIEAEIEAMPESAGVPVVAEGFENDAEGEAFDAEMTVNLVGELPLPGRDDLDEPTVTAASEQLGDVDGVMRQRKHLRGLLEALVFASDSPITPKELGKLASAPQKLVKELLAELQGDYATRGMHLDEVAGGWVFRTSPQYAPFVRDLTKQKPVRLTRAQVETLAIIAYRQPITRPEIEDIRGVDAGAVVKLLLDRDLVRILGKKDEPGRPLIFGTTTNFLTFFGLKSLRDLPTLREFTELTEESREVVERELGDVLPEGPQEPATKFGDASVAAADEDPTSPTEGATETSASIVEAAEAEPTEATEATHATESIVEDEGDAHADGDDEGPSDHEIERKDEGEPDESEDA